MRENIFPIVAAFVGTCIVLGVGFLLYPSFLERVSWRLDGAGTYLHALLSPAGEMPTPAGESREVTASDTTPGPTPRPTATRLIQLTQPTPLPDAPSSPTPEPLPDRIALNPPKWEKQDWNNCGPAALAMYLRYYGWVGTQMDISTQLKPAREDRNVNIEELAYYTRMNAGWLSVHYRVGGDLDLLKRLLASDLPVMLEESFQFDAGYWPDDDLWGAHYQLLTGYDDQAGMFIGQDTYYGANLQIPYETLDKNWQAFNRVYMLVYPPDRQSDVERILGPDWDEEENRRRALETAEKETAVNPQDAFAWFNKGTNLLYFDRYGEAARAFDEARRIGLPQRMLRYQFGPFIAYFHSARMEDLNALTDYALKRTANSEEALLWKGWGLYRMGQKNDARRYFQTALDANPDYLDAQYAIEFLDQG